MSSELLVEEGKVISAGKGFAEISLTKSNLCQECSAKILCKTGKDDLKTIKVIDPLGVTAGDNVKIAITGSSLLKSSFILYGLPLIILVASIMLSTILLDGIDNLELYSFVIGISLTAIYYLLGFFALISFQKTILPKIISQSKDLR